MPTMDPEYPPIFTNCFYEYVFYTYLNISNLESETISYRDFMVFLSDS